MWMWSSAWRTATQRQPSGSPSGAIPVAWTMRRAMSAHCSSVRTRSVLAAADRAVPHVLVRGAAEPSGLLDVQVEVGDEELLGRFEVVGAAGVGGEAVPGGDEVRVGVVLGLLGVVQVPDQAAGALAAADLRDHRGVLEETAWFMVAAMSPMAARTAFRVRSAWARTAVSPGCGVGRRS